MPPRLRKFIGALILIALVSIYALVAITIATYRLADAAGWVHLVYFLLTGLLWIVPAMFVISWMEKGFGGRGRARRQDSGKAPSGPR